MGPFTIKLLSSLRSYGTVYYVITRWFEELSWWMQLSNLTAQVKATVQYFPVVLFITCCTSCSNFESVDGIV